MKWFRRFKPPFLNSPDWGKIQAERESFAVGESRLYRYGNGNLRVTRLAAHSWTFQRVPTRSEQHARP